MDHGDLEKTGPYSRHMPIAKVKNESKEHEQVLEKAKKEIAQRF